MAKTVSDFLVQRLSDWGIQRVFGYPGDGINGVMGALNRADGLLDFIQVRHEENAAFMACAHAKFTNELGVCMATSGPGAIHLLNGLYDALGDHQPVLAILGQQPRTALGGSFQQEVDLGSLFKDVAGSFVQVCTAPAQIRHLVDRAVRTALAERTVTAIIIPNDVQELAYEEPERAHGFMHSGVGYRRPVVVPTANDLQAASDILNEGKKVAILIGAGARNAAEEVVEVAELLGAGIAKALLGKDILPDDLPFVTGSLGLLGTRPSWDMMNDCDTLLMVGTSFPYAEFLPKEGQARGIQIDIDAKNLSLRYPVELGLQGDSQATLQALIPLLKRKEDREWRKDIEEDTDRWWRVLQTRAESSADPINPQQVFWELSKRLPDHAILSADSGTVAVWYSRDIRMRSGMRGSLSGSLATMCPPIPYAIAAKFAYPDRPTIAFIGDGAMQMLGMNGLITVKKYWERWSNKTFIVLVLDNEDLNMVTWEQRASEGDPKYDASQTLPGFPYAEYARLLGFEGIEINKPEDVVPGLERALAANKPVVLDVKSDPNVPVLPPNISGEQAKNFMAALVKGDEDAWGIISQTASEMWDSFFPDKKIKRGPIE